jgi:hypothetical protein
LREGVVVGAYEVYEEDAVADAADAIAKLREVMNPDISVTDIAEATGENSSTVQGRFRNPGRMSLEKFCLYCRAIGIKPADAFGGKEEVDLNRLAESVSSTSENLAIMAARAWYFCESNAIRSVEEFDKRFGVDRKMIIFAIGYDIKVEPKKQSKRFRDL